jgi:hypothetical protein
MAEISKLDQVESVDEGIQFNLQIKMVLIKLFFGNRNVKISSGYNYL